MSPATFDWLERVAESDWSAPQKGWQHLTLQYGEFLSRCCSGGGVDLVDQFKQWANRQHAYDYALAWDQPEAPEALFVIARKVALARRNVVPFAGMRTSAG